MRGACPIVITHALISLESTEQRTVLMLLLSQVLRRDNLEILRPTPHPHVYLHFSLRQEKLVTLLGEIYFHFSLRHLQIPVRRWAMLLSAAYFSKCKVQSQMLRMAWTVKVRAPTSLSRQSPENSCTCMKFAIFFFLWRLSVNSYSNTPGYIWQSNPFPRPLFKEERGVWQI